MSVLSKGHRGHDTHSPYTSPNLFLDLLKNLKFLIDNIYITFLLCIRFRFFTTNESDYISVCTKRYQLNVRYVVCFYMSDLFEAGHYYTRRMICQLFIKSNQLFRV